MVSSNIAFSKSVTLRAMSLLTSTGRRSGRRGGGGDDDDEDEDDKRRRRHGSRKTPADADETPRQPPPSKKASKKSGKRRRDHDAVSNVSSGDSAPLTNERVLQDESDGERHCTQRDAFAEGDIRRQQIAFMNKFPTKKPGRVKPIPAIPTQQKPVPDSLRDKTTKESPRVQGRSGPVQPRRRDSDTRSAHSAMSRRSSASQKSSPRDPLKLETNNIRTRLILEQNLLAVSDLL